MTKSIELAILIGCLLCPVMTGPAWAQQSDGMEWKRTGTKFDPSGFLTNLVAGTRHEHVMMPMRDGAKMATEIFLPPETEKGPWPVVLLRTPYGRGNVAGYAKRHADASVVFITQDSRGRGDSEGKIDMLDNTNEIADGYDTVEWIAKQPWCNGRVGMIGGSGNGMCARMAFLSKAPHLVVVSPGNTAGNTYLYWSFENGVRRWMYTWVRSYRNGRDAGQHPTLASYDLAKWRQTVAEAARDNHIVLFVDDGWYNIFGDAALDDFADFAPTCKVYGNVSAKSHAGVHKMFGGGRRPADVPKAPNFIELLKGTAKAEAPSHMLYYVMGTGSYRLALAWPPPSTPVSYYLAADGKLSTNAPSEKTAAISYNYDPKQPAPSIGGAYSYNPDNPCGPLDQRPLRDRKDVLRFATAPLEKTTEVVGKLRAELYVSTDVPDTMFVVKLLDVHPDGYEMIVREGVFMTRYRNGFDKPAPMKTGEVARLSFEFNSTAVAFNPGHRIGLYITSSSTPAYEVHPNSYEPVASYEKSPVAHNTIQMSAQHPSCIILPVAR